MKKENEIEKLIDNTLESNDSTEIEHMPELKIEVNLIETDDEYIIEAPLPGVSSENIGVNVADDTVTIEATWSEEKEEENKGRPIYKEFMKTNMSRSIILPTSFDRESQTAELQNGLLTIRLKKRPRGKPHSIHVTDEGDE